MHISSFYEIDFIYSLIITVLIEWVIIYLIVSYFFKIKLTKSDILVIGVLPSFLTLPYVWFIFPFFFNENYTMYLWVSESFVLIVEMFILSYFLKLTLKNGLLLSFVANLASYYIGAWLAKII